MGSFLRKRAIFPRRFGGAFLGVSPVFEEANAASAMMFGASITKNVARAESSGHELPLGIKSPNARLDRRALMDAGDYTSLEGFLHQATETANNVPNRPFRLLVAERACYLFTARCVSG